MALLALDIRYLPLSFALGGLETAALCLPLAFSRFVINSSFDIRISSFDSSVSSVVVWLNSIYKEISISASAAANALQQSPDRA